MATKTAKDIEIEINGLTDAQAALLTGVDVDDEYIKKDPSKRDGWDKAFGNSNPDLKEKNKLYREYANSIADLKSRLTNLKSAEQYMTDIVSENKNRINKIYDLQNKAAALSAGIQGTNRVAGGLGAASNVLNNSQGLTDATLRQNVAQNEAARQTALLNNAQQALNIPSTLASIGQANSQIAYNAALTDQLNNKGSGGSGGSGGGYSYSSGGSKGTTTKESDGSNDLGIPKEQYKIITGKDATLGSDGSSGTVMRNGRKRYFRYQDGKLRRSLEKTAPERVKKANG